MEMNRPIRNIEILKCFLTQSCTSRRQLKNPDHRGPKRSPERPRHSQNIVGDEPSAAVCRTGEWHVNRPSRNTMLQLDTISDRPDIRIGCLQIIVDDNCTAWTEFEVCTPRQVRQRPYSNAEDYYICYVSGSLVGCYSDSLARQLKEPSNSLLKDHLHSVIFQFADNWSGHLDVERFEQMIA